MRFLLWPSRLPLVAIYAWGILAAFGGWWLRGGLHRCSDPTDWRAEP